ncbi:hypothetical protein [Fuerstiella marisgermanici]|uniref:hypothetical protein n=1 Tax=Fuerstiella marisgermanici TaxID=1891926 RepID=UPI0011AB7F52|nr:hypothetical protein [Fuerstiella marisgermanici]
MELDFDFGKEMEVKTFHFLNYLTEYFDVDDVDLRFFDAAHRLVGVMSDLEPELGGNPSGHFNPIYAQDFAVSLPGPVRFVNVVLSGSNNEVDFNNIGFSAVDYMGTATDQRGAPFERTF